MHSGSKTPDYASEYSEAISSGEILACKRVKAIYQRLQAERETSDKYYFDAEAGNRPIVFIERFCRQSQGEIGKPIKLELFQKAYIQTLFGWKVKATGKRRFRESMLLMGRKNGKTTLMSGLALYMLTSDHEGAAEIYSVATKKDQAKKCLTEAVNMVKQSPDLRSCIKKRRYDIYFPATSSEFAALASDSNTLDGLNSHCVIIDELHAIRDRGLYDVMQQSTTARTQPLVIMITTNGLVRENIFDEMYKTASDIVDGTAKDDAFFPVLYELDERDEWLKPDCWIKANPGLGTIKQYDGLVRNIEKAKTDSAFKPTVMCKDFNLIETSSNTWLEFQQIYNDATFEDSEIKDTYAIGGCDLSATTDLTCATALIRKKGDPTVYVKQMYFLPENRVAEIEKMEAEEAPYRKWAERGLLTICDGARVNYSDVTAWFMQMQEELNINFYKIGYDRALAGYWVDEMKRNGFNMEAVAQGPFTWAQPMREMGAAFEDKKINYNKNPILMWCLTNTAVKTSGVNNIQPIKVSSKRRIDGTVSLLNAYVIYVKYSDDYLYWVG